MASFPIPSTIQARYFAYLKSIKPDLNINDPNSDFVIRGKALAGLISALYGDQQKVYKDGFINTMRPEALLLKGQDLGIAKQPATPADSPQVRVTGTDGTIIAPGSLTFLYVPTNVLYSNVNGGTIASGHLDLQIQATVVGQIGNVKAPDTLTVVSPPTGVNTSASVMQNIADGADIETDDSYRARLLSREQQPPAGGNQTDYPNFAFSADPSVRSAFIRRFGRGLGTVDIYITTGTTDIDTAVTEGQSIVRIPSSTVLNNVQAYYNSHVPLTDCPQVYAPTEVNVDVEIDVVLALGLTMTSIPSDPINNPLNLNCMQLIQREVARALYKLPVGGRIIPSNSAGQVIASDIEESVDTWLSAVQDTTTGLYFGKIPILADRQVKPLDPPNYNKVLAENQLAAPGTITVTQGV